VKKRVMITGLGTFLSGGKNIDEFRKTLFEGISKIKNITLFDTKGYHSRIAAEIKDYNPYNYFSKKELNRLSRTDQFAIIAAKEAIKISRLSIDELRKKRVGISLGAGTGGMFLAEKYHKEYLKKKKPKPSLLIPFIPSYTTDQVAKELGIKGPIFTTTTACSSSATAIGIGADIILEGIADIMITGGSDSLCELTFGGFNSLRAMDPVTCRPFDKDRAGMVLGEGAAILVLESEQSALSRDAPILGEFLGYAMVGEAYHITAPEETGELQSYVMELALKDANISKDEIDLINAHGTGTPHNDLVETVAIKKLFGKKAYNIPVTANKSMIGHCLGSAGAVEAAASLISILEGFIPPTINIKNLDPKCDLDYVTEGARIKNINYVLSNSFAFGGNLTSLIIGKRA